MDQQQFNQICSIRAPAKAILSGQHAVVFGQDAIAMGIGLYCNLFLSKRKKKDQKASLTICLEIDPEKIEIDTSVLDLFQSFSSKETVSFELFQKQLSERTETKKRSSFAQSIHFKLGLFLKKMNKSWREWMRQSAVDYLISIKSEIPVGKCLGSSAAFNTVLGTGFLIIFNGKYYFSELTLTNQTRQVINQISVEFERVQHGNPSGIDNFVSVHGGLILFNKLKEPKFRSLEKEGHKFKETFDVGIADSKIQKNTKKAVDMVRQKCQQSQQNRNKIKLIGAISHSIMQVLQSNSAIKAESIFELVRQNHQLLQELDLSHPELERLIKIGKDHGWIGKITGSGMGGCILLIAEANKWKENSEIQLAQLEEKGLRVYFDQKM